ncbi:MAG: hypothetical protein ACXW07_08010 [Nitrososphaeraceae archaeon]
MRNFDLSDVMLLLGFLLIVSSIVLFDSDDEPLDKDTFCKAGYVHTEDPNGNHHQLFNEHGKGIKCSIKKG